MNYEQQNEELGRQLKMSDDVMRQFKFDYPNPRKLFGALRLIQIAQAEKERENHVLH